MENKFIGNCPRCDNKLIATRLACNKCDLELIGDFELSKFDYLSNEDLDFIVLFLKYQGNLKALQEDKKMSYPAVKKKLADILINLGIEEYEEDKEVVSEMSNIKFLPIEASDSLVIKKIKEKLNACEGKTSVPLFTGKLCEIWYDNNEKGLVSPKIPLANHLTWDVFDAAVEVVINNGGKAEKGKAQSGAKLGSDKLPLNSVEGYIASKVHGVEEGKSAFGPAFVICAILDWAGVCKNERGYLSISPEFLMDNNENC